MTDSLPVLAYTDYGFLTQGARPALWKRCTLLWCILTEECLIAAYDSRVLEGHEDADLVEGVFEILRRDILNIQSLEGIDLVVEFTFYLKKEINHIRLHTRSRGRCGRLQSVTVR